MSSQSAREALGHLLHTAGRIGASEVHLTLPVRPEQECGTSLRVAGILTDLDPEVEAALASSGTEVLDEIYAAAVSGHSERLRDAAMEGQFGTEAGIPMPEGMTGVDVLLLPGPDGRTNVTLRPRPLGLAAMEGEHPSWLEAVQATVTLASRPSRGVTLFVSPEPDVAALLMMQAAHSIRLDIERRVTVFDSLPWSPSSQVAVASVAPRAKRAAMSAAASTGCDVLVAGSPADHPDFTESVREVCAAGVHVWVRCRGSVSESGLELARRIGLPAPPAAIVRCARVMTVDKGAGEPLSDPFAAEWLMESHGITGHGGCLQRKANADFPTGMCIAMFSHAPETEETVNALARLGAQMVDRGLLCGLDASRKLS